MFEHAIGEVWADCPVRGVFARNVGRLGPPALSALSALAVVALALGRRRTAASAAPVKDRREEMADARLVGDVEAVGAPWGRTRCHGHGRDEVGDGEQGRHAGREAERGPVRGVRVGASRAIGAKDHDGHVRSTAGHEVLEKAGELSRDRSRLGEGYAFHGQDVAHDFLVMHAVIRLQSSRGAQQQAPREGILAGRVGGAKELAVAQPKQEAPTVRCVSENSVAPRTCV